MKCTALTSNLAALTLGALIALVPASAEAGWGLFGGSGGGGSYGSAGSYGSYGSGASYGSAGASYGSTGAGYGSTGAGYGSTGAAYSAGYGSNGSTGGSSGGSSGAEPGPFRRMFSHLHHKVHNHIARRAAYGSVGGSSGGGSSGGYATSYGSYGSSYSGGSSGGYGAYSGGSSGGAVSYGSTGAMYAPSYGSAGSMYYGASNQSARGVGGLVSNSTVSDDSVMLTVAVPTSAKVFVNENPTTSKGAIRQFVSRGLVGGKAYKFDIRAELAGADGKIVSETKSVTVAAGQRQAIEFAMAKQQNRPVETAVTVHVPLGAKVILAGKETSVSGLTRTFRTNQLALGQVWEDYTIEVKVGEKTKQQKVRLLAGDQIELTFDFGATTDRIASR